MKRKLVTLLMIAMLGITGIQNATAKETNAEKTISTLEVSEPETELNESLSVDESNVEQLIDNQTSENAIQESQREELTDLEDYYVTAPLNIRSKPSTDSEIVGSLNVNDKVSVKHGDEWAKIYFNDEIAYVSQKYLSETPVEIKTESNENVSAENKADTTQQIQASTTPALSGNITSDILTLVNAYRTENGLPQLSVSSKLNQIAQVRAQEASVYWSHTRPDGRDNTTVFTDYGVNGFCGENLAYGFTTGQGFIDGWKASPGHNAAMLDRDYKSMGVAIYQDSEGRIYAALEFNG